MRRPYVHKKCDSYSWLAHSVTPTIDKQTHGLKWKCCLNCTWAALIKPYHTIWQIVIVDAFMWQQKGRETEVLKNGCSERFFKLVLLQCIGTQMWPHHKYLTSLLKMYGPLKPHWWLSSQNMMWKWCSVGKHLHSTCHQTLFFLLILLFKILAIL